MARAGQQHVRVQHGVCARHERDVRAREQRAVSGEVRYLLRGSCYARGTRCPVLTWYMLLPGLVRAEHQVRRPEQLRLQEGLCLRRRRVLPGEQQGAGRR
eukprot:1901540-Rhodomonas_salina.2